MAGLVDGGRGVVPSDSKDDNEHGDEESSGYLEDGEEFAVREGLRPESDTSEEDDIIGVVGTDSEEEEESDIVKMEEPFVEAWMDFVQYGKPDDLCGELKLEDMCLDMPGAQYLSEQWKLYCRKQKNNHDHDHSPKRKKLQKVKFWGCYFGGEREVMAWIQFLSLLGPEWEELSIRDEKEKKYQDGHDSQQQQQQQQHLLDQDNSQLSSSNQEKNYWPLFLQQFQDDSRLRVLDLADSDVEGIQQGHALSALLSSATCGIHTLHISGWTFDRDSFTLVAQEGIQRHVFGLREIQVDCRWMEPPSLLADALLLNSVAAPTAATTLRSLHIHGFLPLPGRLFALARILRECCCLEHLSVPWCRNLFAIVDDGAYHQFTEAVLHNRNLRSLDLRFCDLTDELAPPLLQILHTNSTLQTLDISGALITQSLCHSIPHFQGLRTLGADFDVASCQAALRQNTTLLRIIPSYSRTGTALLCREVRLVLQRNRLLREVVPRLLAAAAESHQNLLLSATNYPLCIQHLTARVEALREVTAVYLFVKATSLSLVSWSLPPCVGTKRHRVHEN